MPDQHAWLTNGSRRSYFASLVVSSASAVTEEAAAARMAEWEASRPGCVYGLR